MKASNRIKTIVVSVALCLSLAVVFTGCFPSTEDEGNTISNSQISSEELSSEMVSSDVSSKENSSKESSTEEVTSKAASSKTTVSTTTSSKPVSSKLTSSKPTSSKPTSSKADSSSPAKAPASSKESPSSVPVSSAPVVKDSPDYTMSQFKSIEDDLVSKVNELRTSKGLSTLKANATLKKVAALRSKEMTDSAYFEHTRPNGTDYSTAFDEIGYAWARAGENIAFCSGYSENQIGDIFYDGWLNSPGHYANMVRPEYTEIGISVYTDGTKYYATQSFGVPK